MNLGKLIERVEAEGVSDRATHSVVWNNEVSQATKMRIDALLLKCKQKRSELHEL